nr:hypothetical protein [Tanacetum cinerariifolium]
MEQPNSPEAAPQSSIQTPHVPQDEDEREPMFIQSHDPDYVPEPMYPEYIPLEDEHVLSAEEQPLPLVVSPTVESPEYVAESDPEEDPEEYKDDEIEDGPVDYPMDGGDDGDDDDEAEVERLLAMPTPPPSPLASLSPPSVGERLARCTASSACLSPPHVPSPLIPSIGCPTQIQTLRLGSTQVLIDAVTAALLSPPLPPPLYIPPLVDRRDDILETEMPPRKRLCLSTLGSKYKIGESFTARPTGGREIDSGFVSTLDAEARRRGIGEVGYGIRDTRVDPTETVPEIAPMTVGEDSPSGDHEEAYAAREAWAHSIGLSQAVYFELQTHREHVYTHEFQLQAHQTQLQLQGTLIQTQHQLHETRFQMQQAEIAELRETDRRRQAQNGRDAPIDGRHETRDG